MEDQKDKKGVPPSKVDSPKQPPKLPDAWQRLLDAVRKHYESPPHS